jgi:enoyl-CoA hydratase/carnithine racemase
LGEELMKEFEELYTKFSTDPAATAAVLISGKPGCFIAGADIKVKLFSIVLFKVVRGICCLNFSHKHNDFRPPLSPLKHFKGPVLQ